MANRDTLSVDQLDGEKASRPNGKNYLLAIAINDYQHCSKLSNAVLDVEAFITVMITRYHFETAYITLIKDAQATKRRIEGAFDRLIDLVTPQDNLIVYFSGHGRYHQRRGGFWIPVEAGKGDEHWPDYFSNDQVKSYLSKIKSFHTFLIADSCFSGTLFIDKSKEKFSGDRRDTEPSRWGLTSGKKEIVSDGQPGQHSPFAIALLDVLRKADQPIGVMRICDLVLEKVAANAQQTPMGSPLLVPGHQGGQMVLYFREDEEAEWQAALATSTSIAYSTFYHKYPSGKYAAAALEKLALAEEKQYWDKVPKNRESALLQYLREYPDGVYVAEARRLLAQLQPKPKPSPPPTHPDPTPIRWKDFVSKPVQLGLAMIGLVLVGALGNQFYKAVVGTGTEPLAQSTKTTSNTIPTPDMITITASDTIPTPDMITITGGTFEMGDVMGDKESDDEKVHTVTVGDFMMAKTELTFEEYDRFCEATKREKPDDNVWGRGKRPVIKVRWLDAIAYCNWLSEKHGLQPVYTGKGATLNANRNANGYCLPTEAEWEYAARAGGKKVRFGNGKDIANPKEINFDGSEPYKRPYSLVGEYRSKTVPVGSLHSPNALGLHDMSGNVWEWCWDWYAEKFYYNSPAKDPHGPTSGNFRVLRGGSWNDIPNVCRASSRRLHDPDYRDLGFGFRLARH